MSLGEEIIRVSATTHQVKCKGNGPVLGHPLVYYEFGNKNSIRCQYCGRLFVRGEQAAKSATSKPPADSPTDQAVGTIMS